MSQQESNAAEHSFIPTITVSRLAQLEASLNSIDSLSGCKQDLLKPSDLQDANESTQNTLITDLDSEPAQTILPAVSVKTISSDLQNTFDLIAAEPSNPQITDQASVAIGMSVIVDELAQVDPQKAEISQETLPMAVSEILHEAIERSQLTDPTIGQIDRENAVSTLETAPCVRTGNPSEEVIRIENSISETEENANNSEAPATESASLLPSADTSIQTANKGALTENENQVCSQQEILIVQGENESLVKTSQVPECSLVPEFKQSAEPAPEQGTPANSTVSFEPVNLPINSEQLIPETKDSQDLIPNLLEAPQAKVSSESTLLAAVVTSAIEEQGEDVGTGKPSLPEQIEQESPLANNAADVALVATDCGSQSEVVPIQISVSDLTPPSQVENSQEEQVIQNVEVKSPRDNLMTAPDLETTPIETSDPAALVASVEINQQQEKDRKTREDAGMGTPEREFGSEITDRLPTEIVNASLPWLPDQPLSLHQSHQASTQIAYGMSSQTTMMPRGFEEIVQLSSPESHRTDRPMLLQMQRGDAPFSRSRASSPGDTAPAQSVVPSQERCEGMAPKPWQSETGSENNDRRSPRHHKSLLIIQETPERSSAHQSMTFSHPSMDPLRPAPTVIHVNPPIRLEGMAVSPMTGTKSHSASVAENDNGATSSPKKEEKPKEQVIMVDGIKLPESVLEVSSSSVMTIHDKNPELMVSLKIGDGKAGKGASSVGDLTSQKKYSKKKKQIVPLILNEQSISSAGTVTLEGQGAAGPGGSNQPGDKRGDGEAESLDLNRKFSKLSAKVRTLKKELKEAKETLAGYEKFDPAQDALERRQRLEKEDQEKGNRKLSVLQIINQFKTGEGPGEADQTSKLERASFQLGSSSTNLRALHLADHTSSEIQSGGWTSRERKDDRKTKKAEAEKAKLKQHADAEPVKEHIIEEQVSKLESTKRAPLKTEMNLKMLQSNQGRRVFHDEDEEDSSRRVVHAPKKESEHRSGRHRLERNEGSPVERGRLGGERVERAKDKSHLGQQQWSGSPETKEVRRSRRQERGSPSGARSGKELGKRERGEQEKGWTGSERVRETQKDHLREHRDHHKDGRDSTKEQHREQLGKRVLGKGGRGQSVDSSSSSDTQERILKTMRIFQHSK